MHMSEFTYAHRDAEVDTCTACSLSQAQDASNICVCVVCTYCANTQYQKLRRLDTSLCCLALCSIAKPAQCDAEQGNVERLSVDEMRNGPADYQAR